MEAAIVDYLDKIIDPFLNPQKRVYLGYLIAAVLVAVGLSYILSGKSTRKTLSTLFARRIGGRNLRGQTMESSPSTKQHGGDATFGQSTRLSNHPFRPHAYLV